MYFNLIVRWTCFIISLTVMTLLGRQTRWFGLVGYSKAVEYESLLSKVKGSLHLDMIEGKVPVLREEEELRWHFFKLSQVTDTHSYNYNEPETCRCSFYKSVKGTKITPPNSHCKISQTISAKITDLDFFLIRQEYLINFLFRNSYYPI